MAGLLNNPYSQLDSQVRSSRTDTRLNAPNPPRRGHPTLQRLTSHTAEQSSFRQLTCAPADPLTRPPPRPRSRQIEQLLSGVIIPEDEVREICEKTKEVLSKEENVVPVRAPVTVVRPREPNQFTIASHFPSICPFNP